MSARADRVPVVVCLDFRTRPGGPVAVLPADTPIFGTYRNPYRARFLGPVKIVYLPVDEAAAAVNSS